MEKQNIERCRRAFTCLIADDSEFARKNIAKVVKMLGGDVVGEATNGEDALDLYSRLAPDLVLLDITMPVLDGVDTLRGIMERDRSAKVIMVSSIGHKEMLWKALGLGAAHFVTKPYNPGYAGTIIKTVMDEREVQENAS
ncbi:MAG: response regulator [Nitrospirae bacterium]|nr:response regulator [Nitrospirota bacterium]